LRLCASALRTATLALLAGGFAFAGNASAAGFQLRDTNGVITVAMPGYRLEITKQNFRYGFTHPDGTVIAPANAEFGLEFGGGHSVDTTLRSSAPDKLTLEVTNDKGEHATVEIEPAEHHVRFSATQSQTNRILARIGGISPAFGLADHAAFGRTNTEVTGYSDGHFRAQEAPGHKRLISNFVISPRRGIAMVNMEKGLKLVRVRADDAAQGVAAAVQMPALYYFLGTPPEIYAAYLQARNREGYTVFKPKYEFFGVGWEAFGALGWNTNEKTVTENVERYLSLGYPLEWMVVGSGFWPNEDPAMRATTSFGLWDKVRYPDPRRFIEHFKSRGLKFFLGLRISFIEDGPYSAEGVAKGYFLKEDGKAKAWQLGFPKRPAYLLDGTNPDAVKWYVGLCQKWLDVGVDGFKEDLFTYKVANMREGNIDTVNEALMRKGVFIMGRNGYLGSACDVQRIEDFNFDQNQDRGPLNVLAFTYSGFPYAYPDITGGTFGEHRPMPPMSDPRMQSYMMRAAQFDSVNPAMAVGMGPWNFGEKVGKVMLEAAQLHARLHPYIYSAAVDAFETGFPWTMAPLPLVFPDDPQAYGRENTAVRGYQWMFGPSLLACPLYGNDYATAETRDVYLPAGKWMNYDTGEVHTGPKLLKNFSLPIGKTPLFVGGKGVLVLRELPGQSIEAVVYPIAANGSTYRFTHRDGTTRTTITNDNAGWNAETLAVTDTTENKPVVFERDSRTGAIRFQLTPGHNYRLSGGAAKN
jgi:alpha-glucosidase (family GH31 glycosyl hydrolase)